MQTLLMRGFSIVLWILTTSLVSAATTNMPGKLVGWSSGGSGNTNVTVLLNNGVIAVTCPNEPSIGGNGAMALKEDGTICAWCINFQSCQVTNIPAGLSNVTAMAMSEYCALVLKSNGTLVAWGRPADAYLTTIPLQCTNITAIAGGLNHFVALRNDGVVIAWGSNANGQTNVPSNLTNAVAIAAGREHSMAMRADGSVVSWGGRYGPAPADMTNANPSVVTIAAGGLISMALKTNGQVRAWGYPNSTSAFTNISAITAGALTAWGVRSNGTIVCDPNATDHGIPPGMDRVISMASCGAFSYAIVQDLNVSLTPTNGFDAALQFYSFTNRNYSVQWSSNLFDWYPLSDPVAGVSANIQLLDTNAFLETNRFYRVQHAP